jgi:hypothetical protein
MAAPTGFAQSSCRPSELQSHAGNALGAKGESLLSRSRDCRNPGALVSTVIPSVPAPAVFF